MWDPYVKVLNRLYSERKGGDAVLFGKTIRVDDLPSEPLVRFYTDGLLTHPADADSKRAFLLRTDLLVSVTAAFVGSTASGIGL